MTDRARSDATINQIERVTIESDLSFDALVSAFEHELGVYDHAVGERLVADHASWDKACETISTMRGPHGLMTFFSLDLGKTASLKGELRQSRLYLIGNALIATDIVANDLRAGMLVPFRVQLYAEGGKAYLSYDRPGSSLGSLQNSPIDAIGVSLDGKLNDVIAATLKAVPTRLNEPA